MKRLAYAAQNPIIIIGAPRSGTNMLRDVLTRFEGVGTWPCDEINLIWRKGNVRVPTDELTIEQAAPPTCRYLKSFFNRLAVRRHLRSIVEKTCANSLRVGFVNHVFPNARFIFIVRDGRDAAVSAMKRWVAPLNAKYLMKKLRYVPVFDVPHYALGFVKNRFHRLSSPERRLANWGPRFHGLEGCLAERSLEEVCAMQWRRCVELADQQLRVLPADRVHRVKYEEFVNDPQTELKRILEFGNIPFEEHTAKQAVKDVRPNSVGNWTFADAKSQQQIVPIVNETLEAFGYGTRSSYGKAA